MIQGVQKVCFACRRELVQGPHGLGVGPGSVAGFDHVEIGDQILRTDLNLPLQESKWKQEAIFVLKSVNDSLIVFFRGQILVAMCVGALTTISFLLLGLNYAVLLGVMTGLLVLSRTSA